MHSLRLVKVKKVVPRPVLVPATREHVDIENLRAIIVNRMHVLRDYSKQVTLPALRSGANVSNDRLLQQLKDWCAEAEVSGIQVLADFAARLRSYRLS
jgi:stearoyl-CoA desaturase (delta-9 desaturase)